MNTFEKIKQGLKTLLSGEYTVNVSYWNQQYIDDSGVIAINLSTFENLQHGTENDFQLNFQIKGQTFISEDLKQETISDMFSFIMQKLKLDDFRKIENRIVGAVITNGQFISDQEINGFSISLTLYVNNVEF